MFLLLFLNPDFSVLRFDLLLSLSLSLTRVYWSMALSFVNRSFSFLFFLLLVGCCGSAANVVLLIGTNVSLSFDSIEANFAPSIKSSGEPGVLHLAKPLDACSTLENKVQLPVNCCSPFVLIIRGGCSFEDKVRRAQVAGFKAAIVYDNVDGRLIAMAGSSTGIKIHAVFVTKESGETLKKYTGLANVETWIVTSFENSVWTIMAVSFISLLAMSALLATCFFVHRHRIRRVHSRFSQSQEFQGMSRRVVKAMPSLIFTTALEDNCTSVTCAICLEDYTAGEKLRILPCRHKFHAFCVDSWLTAWRTFCPVCKRDARTSTGDPPPSESTPLLSSTASSFASSILSSVRTSLPPSSAIHISPPSRSPSVSRNHSLSSTPYHQQSLRSSFRQSPSLSVSRSSFEIRNASSQRSYTSNLVSPYSSCYASMSPLHSRYMIPLIPSSSNASPSIIGSSSHQHNPLHISVSAASFSPFASARSLTEC